MHPRVVAAALAPNSDGVSAPATCRFSSWVNRASTSSSSNSITPVRTVSGAPLMKQSAGCCSDLTSDNKLTG